MSVAEESPERIRLRLAHRDDNANRNGTLHGGVIASFVHMAGALALGAKAGGAVDLSVHFVAAAVRKTVDATAAVSRRGREIAFGEIDVLAESGELVARALLAARSSVPRGGRGRSADGAGGAHADAPSAGRLDPGDAARIDAALAARLESLRFSGSPFSARLQIGSARLADGGVVALLPWQEAIADADGHVHEGAIATLVDAAGGGAAWAVEGFDTRGRAATIAMHLTFAAPSAGEDVVAIARPAWRSGEIFSIPVDLYGRQSRRALATGSVVYRIVRPAG